MIQKSAFSLLIILVSLSATASGTDETSSSKILYLVRHAKSSDADSSLQDFDRPLNDRGFSNAPEMGKRLHKQGIQVDLIVASPSKRTTQTIELIAKEIKYDFEKIQWDSTIYRCTANALLQSINRVDDAINSVMFVGHNPSITQMANFLQTDSTFSEVPTGGVVAIRFQTSDWESVSSKNAQLLFFMRPDRN